ncbi:MAG TPA: CHAD domain-containing protein [Puia sp.]|jgi:CHAD domain-containing protein|nr:CHAD domain-containing protein [Puia sp.]
MLSRKKQKKYLTKNERDLLVQLQVFSESGDADALHRIRLDVKKIKAFAQMVRSCSDKKMSANKRIFKDLGLLKKMFRQAGKVRDASNTSKLLQQRHWVPAAFTEEQDDLRTTAADKFRQQVGEYRKKGKKAGRQLLKDVNAIHTGCIRDWYAGQLIRIGVLLTASGDQLHEARKKIKELLYVQKVLPPRLVESLNLDKGYLDELQEVIGNWHDMALVVAAYAGREGVDSQAMVDECAKREKRVREMAGDFYLRAHLS